MSSNLSSRQTDDNGAPCDDTRGGYSCPNPIVASFNADGDVSSFLTIHEYEADSFVDRLAKLVRAKKSRHLVPVQVAVQRLLSQATPRRRYMPPMARLSQVYWRHKAVACIINEPASVSLV